MRIYFNTQAAVCKNSRNRRLKYHFLIINALFCNVPKYTLSAPFCRTGLFRCKNARLSQGFNMFLWNWDILENITIFFCALVKILSQRLIFDAYCCNIILLLLNYYVLGGMLWIQNTKACLRRGKSRIAKSKTAL